MPHSPKISFWSLKDRKVVSSSLLAVKYFNQCCDWEGIWRVDEMVWVNWYKMYHCKTLLIFLHKFFLRDCILALFKLSFFSFSLYRKLHHFRIHSRFFKILFHIFIYKIACFFLFLNVISFFSLAYGGMISQTRSVVVGLFCNKFIGSYCTIIESFIIPPALHTVASEHQILIGNKMSFSFFQVMDFFKYYCLHKYAFWRKSSQDCSLFVLGSDRQKKSLVEIPRCKIEL